MPANRANHVFLKRSTFHYCGVGVTNVRFAFIHEIPRSLIYNGRVVSLHDSIAAIRVLTEKMMLNLSTIEGIVEYLRKTLRVDLPRESFRLKTLNNFMVS